MVEAGSGYRSERKPFRRRVCTFSLDETAERVAEALFDAAIGPDHDGDERAVGTGFIEGCLAGFDPALVVGKALGIPLFEKLDAGVTAANGVDHRAGGEAQRGGE